MFILDIFLCLNTSYFKNGMIMAKYVIFHPEAFDRPGYAFLLGCLVCLRAWFIQSVAILMSMNTTLLFRMVGRWCGMIIIIMA